MSVISRTMDTRSSQLDIAVNEDATPLRTLCGQLETYEMLSREELVRVCNNLETTIQLKDSEIERINKHTDHILAMYYDVENKLAERNGELVSCQRGLKEVQEALSQWRRELACSSLSTNSSRYHPSTPEISSGTGSSEGDYRMPLQRDVDMEDCGETSGSKGDVLQNDYPTKDDNKNERRQSSRKSNSLDLLGKNLHPVLHRRQRNGNNNNSSSYELEKPLYGADLKSPRRPDAGEHPKDSRRHHRPQPLSKPLFHSVNGPLRVVYDDRQMPPHGNILSRSMALAATDSSYGDADAGLQMSFYRKAHSMSEEGAYLSNRKKETGYHKLNGTNFYERSNVIETDANNVKYVTNGNGRLSPELLVASPGGIEDNSDILTRPKVETGTLGDDHPTVTKMTTSDLIDTEKYQFSEEAFVHDIIESLIRRVCCTDHLE